MDCAGTEKLLALYYENRLPAETARELEDHIASCDTCSESAEAWLSLEPRLGELKDDIPLPSLVASRVLNDLGLGKKNIISIFRFGRPALVASGLVCIAALFYIFRESIERVIPGLTESYSMFYDSSLRFLSAWLSKLIAGPTSAYMTLINGMISAIEKTGSWYEAVDFRILLAVYILMILSMSLSFGRIIRKILRD